MRTTLPLVLALLAALAAAAWVRRPGEPDPLAPGSLAALLPRPLDRSCADAAEPARPFWRALLELSAATRTEQGFTLRLGRVLADPSIARIAAEHAGELLALEAEGPQGKLGRTLAQAVLAGPATESTPDGRVLRLYGCRHSADLDAGPVLEDTYHARLALAEALRAAAEAAGTPIRLLGQDAPVKGGVNFEVQLDGTVQAIQVTFDGSDQPALRARRSYRPSAPNDARARAGIVQALERLAAQADIALALEGREAGVPDGVDLRVERYGEHLAISAVSGATRISTHLVLASPP